MNLKKITKNTSNSVVAIEEMFGRIHAVVCIRTVEYHTVTEMTDSETQRNNHRKNLRQ